MISPFFIYIQDVLGSLFSGVYLSDSLTFFEKKQQKKGEYILYLFFYPHYQTCQSFPLFIIIHIQLLAF